MKNIAFIFFSLLGLVTVFAQDYEYKPFVEEGKTWWYSQVVVDPSNSVYEQFYYGFSMLGDTVLEDTVWKKVHTVSAHSIPYLTHPIGLVREQNGQIYTRSVDSYPGYDPVKEALRDMGCVFFTDLAFDLNLKVGESFKDIPVVAVDTVESRKVQYLKDSWNNTFTIYEGIGSYEREWSSGLSFLFWRLPTLLPDCVGLSKPAVLRYVTDADLNILFTGRGGSMPWEQGLVEEVVDEPCGEAVYFNLQGQPCAEPLSPGIYIRRQGSRAAKVSVK